MPDINFDCPHCGQNLDAPEDMAGTGIACPACKETIQIPGGPAANEGVVEEDLPEQTKKSSTMRLELPKNVMPPAPRRRIVRIKRLDK